MICRNLLTTSLIFFMSGLSAQAKKDERGLLPEVKAVTGNESENEKKALSSEILITKTETKAIDSLKNILKKKKGSKEEPDLWYRLAELYMRRSKSGRFFDLFMNEKTKQMSSIPQAQQTGVQWIKEAIAIYEKIESQFKNYADMDSVLFNNAFAHQQLGQLKGAETLYTQLSQRFPKSPLIPDSILALGELLYDQGRFSAALDQFVKIEKYPENRVYSYGLYKTAWTHYNLKESSRAIQKLVQVVKISPPLVPGENFTRGHYLRKEALRDLALFVSDTLPASDLYGFFKSLASPAELGPAMIDLAKLYETHSRQKDLNVFLSEFIEKNPADAALLKAHLFLVGANEDLKARELVIQHLRAASDLCKPNSIWRVDQSTETIAESCTQDFHRESLEIAAKWWEIWLKNKKHVAFSELTEKAFRLILENDDSTNPDLKTRYALAELLFQLEKFEEASDQYKFVGDKSTDPVMGHDATYGALYAKEKSLDKDRTPVKEAERKKLALNYLSKFPKGASAPSVSFKLGLIHYEEKNFDEALRWLQPLAEKSESADLKVKSEDLILDIYNLRKDFSGLKTISQAYLKKAADEKRKKSLEKIFEEAHYSEVQEKSKSIPKSEFAHQLLDYVKTHPDSRLSKTAHWQALSLLYTEGHSVEAADETLQYAQKFPQDEKNLEALKEAAKSYAESGRVMAAAELTLQLSEKDKKNKNSHLEMAADFLTLENQLPRARKIYNTLLAESDKTQRARLLSKILGTFTENSSDPEFSKTQSLILSQNIEPYATQILTKRAGEMLKEKKWKEAFESARKIMSRDSSAEFRAEARLIQAEVLEYELVTQSVKSSKEDRLSIVLAMKTEKLDKAQTAYLSASKMNPDPKIQLLAFQGVDRCYQNYIESLKGLNPPASLSAEDQKALRQEIAKIIEPMDQKRTDNLKQIQALAQNALSKEKNINWESLTVESTVKPLAKYPEARVFQQYFPAALSRAPSSLKKLEPREKSRCEIKKWMASAKKTENLDELLSSCYQAHDFKALETLALEMTKTKENREQGLYVLSLASEKLGLELKAYWLAEQVLKNQNEHPLATFQKARLAYKIEGLNSALPLFGKILKTSMSSTEIETLKGIQAYNEANFETVIQIFSKFPKETLAEMKVGLLLSEAYAQKGDSSQALRVATDLLSQKAVDKIEVQLHVAHLLEMYKNSAPEALSAYQKALALTMNPEQKDWIGKKVQYLSSLNQGNTEVKK